MEVTAGETDSEPETALAPDQAPEAEQEETLVEDQERVEDWPEVMLKGEAEKDRVGEGVGVLPAKAASRAAKSTPGSLPSEAIPL